MALTKTRLVLIAVVLTAVFFVLLLLSPESIIGQRDEKILLFIPKILFLAITAAIAIVFVLISTS